MTKRIVVPKCFGQFPRAMPHQQAENACKTCPKMQTCILKTRKDRK